MNQESKPLQVLHQQSQHQKWMPALIIATIGLGITLALIWKILSGGEQLAGFQKNASWIWFGGLFLTACAAAAARWWRNRPETNVAQVLDHQWSAKNRLEAACELSDAETPLAAAQRSETEQFLANIPQKKTAPRIPLWPVASMMVTLLLMYGFTGIYVVQKASATPVKPVVAPPKLVIPTARIQWKSPKAESKATKVEEVPLTAEIQSDTGLHDLKLEIAVNGEPKKTVALTGDEFTKGGSAPLKASIYLDEVEVEPFDVVSYYIHGSRNHSAPLPETASALQFVQIRPFRDDASKGKPGNGTCKCLDLIMKIKAAQLTAMKQNFVLAHADLARTDATWLQENTRVGENQKTLVSKTEEAAKVGTQTGWPANVVDLILQAKPEMQTAGDLITSIQNPEATKPQGKALSKITAVEKYLKKALAEASKGKSKPKTPNPFADEQQFKLKPREQTSAGGLEKAAQDQADLLAKLDEKKEASAAADQKDGSPQDEAKKSNEGSKPNEAGQKPGQQGEKGSGQEGKNGEGSQGKGSPSGQQAGQSPGNGTGGSGGESKEQSLAEQQKKISQSLAQLKMDTGFSEEVRKAIEEAHQAANEAINQLEANDKTAAKEPASRTLSHLQSALNSMKAASDKEAAAALAQAQRELNEMANAMKQQPKDKSAAEDTASQLAKTRSDLQAQAQRHQEHGSATTAEQLAKFAKQIENKKVLDDLKKLAAGQNSDGTKAIAKLDELARQAAAEQLKLAEGKQAVAQTIAELQRAATNIQRLASKNKASAEDRETMMKELLSDVQNSAQKARAAAGSMTGGEKADALLAAVGTLTPGPGDHPRPDALIGLVAPISELVALLGEELTNLERQEVVAQLHPEEAPAAYKKPVAEYFERLSRDYERTAPAPTNEEPEAEEAQ